MKKMILRMLLLILFSIMILGCNKEDKYNREGNIKVVDLKNREIVLDKPAEKVFLGFYLENYIAVTGDKELEKVVSMAKGETKDLFSQLWQGYRKEIAKLDSIVDTGSIYLDTFSVEKLIETMPEVVIVAPFQFDKLGDNVKKLEDLGIQIVVLDYNSLEVDKHYESTMILGEIMGEEERAKELADNYKNQIEDIKDKVSKAKNLNQKVYFELANQGADTYGNSYADTLWGGILNNINCNNIATGKVEGHGPLNPEYVITQNPEIIFFAGQVREKETDQCIPIGFGIEKEKTLNTTKIFINRPAWNEIEAIKSNRVYVVDHSGLRTLYDYVYMQYLAKKIHPEEFKDVDPLKNLKEFYDKYLPIELDGTFMIGIEENE